MAGSLSILVLVMLLGMNFWSCSPIIISSLNLPLQQVTSTACCRLPVVDA